MDKTGKLHYIELGIDDMTNLVELSDDSLLYNLQTRYSQKIIYTYIGSILISINPYTELDIYDKKHIFRYQNKSLQEVPPHLFGIAEINYSKMMLENENQVIVISGESGAGKTESFKRILRYLAYTSGGVKEVNTSNREVSNDIANKILDSTPLLESFGNAKTIRNDNSSRFGKYVEIFFENGTICGSRTTNYLLEKSRIVNINPDERGYHIFYELLQGLDSFGKSQYYLKNVVDYAYLNNARDFSVKGRDDATNLKEFMSQWSTLGLNNDDLDVTMRIISAVLHLGNIKFKEEDDASYLVEKDNVEIVAKMLKVDCSSLINCLIMKTTETVKESACSPVGAEQATNLRDTLAKHLYSELFDWIVSKVNESLNQKTVTIRRTPSHLDKSLNSAASKFRCIAMLDIYGFENFPENSLEQLCINYANETLQQFFNKYVFELEQAEYKVEGISWHYVTYPDNQPIIDLLSAKPSGIIQILNDECSIPQGSDDAFLIKCHNVHQKNSNFEKPKKMYPPQFIIRHFAGNIYYNVKGFLDKNRDLIRKEAIDLIERCGVPEIATMFRKKKDRTIKNPNVKARTPAVMADFQNSLATLLNKMKTCQPWFIRCLKPNNKKQALSFDKDIVMDQMRYTGILETVKIRKSGFPIRIMFNLFLSRFYLLQSKDMRHFAKKEPQEACLKMMPKFGGQKGKDFEVGKSKLFLKEHFARHLEMQVRIIRDRSAIKIQRRWRAYWKIREIIIKNRAATTLQAIARGFLERRRIRRLRVAIVKLQAYVRMQLVRQKFIEEHPEFLKYTFNKVDNSLTSKSSATVYKFPEVEVSHKTEKSNEKKKLKRFNYNLLKIPIKLAFLLEKSTESYGHGHYIPSSDSIIQTGRAQHLYNRDDYKLPDDINEYLIRDYVEEFGNNVSLESKTKPIQNPFLKGNLSSDIKDDCLNAHKLVLRLIYVDTMPWFHRYLIGSYLSYMASISSQLQIEILLQIIAETINMQYQGEAMAKHHFLNENDTKRISRAWTLLGNLLSHIVPVPEIFNYILQYISGSFNVDQACTCQEKLLHFINNNNYKIPRLFPASNLEWRGNSRGSKTSLKTYYADGLQNAVHVNSFTTAESLANHALCFRLKRYKINKGWSISMVSEDFVVDCSGHNYVFDAISGLELPNHWMDIVGYGIEHKFLISKKNNSSGTSNSEFIQLPVNHRKNNSKDTISSKKSMDSWVDKYFDKSFKHEEGSNVRIHDYIHGLEDELKAQQHGNQNNLIFPVGNPGLLGRSQLIMPGVMTPQPIYQQNPQIFNPQVPQAYYYPPQSDKRYLEDQLNAVELQNKVIQSSIENELLQKRLQELRQEGPVQTPLHFSNPQLSFLPNQSTFLTQSNPYMMQEQFLPANYELNQHSQHQYESSDSPSSFGQHHFVSDSSLLSIGNDIPKSNNSDLTKRIPIQIPRSSSIPTNINRDARDSSPQVLNRTIENDRDKPKIIHKRKSIVKYSEVAPPSTVVVDDSIVLPELTKNEKITKSQLRAAEIPKVNVAHRAAFLDKFFLDKNYQSPDKPKVKRTAPSIPVENLSPPPVHHVTFIPPPPPPPLIHQPKLIPRPSIHSEVNLLRKEKIPSNNNDITNEKDLQETLAELDNSFNSIDRSTAGSRQIPEIKKRKKRKLSLSKTAIILSGLPDIRYFTYVNSSWFPMVKIELFLPKEIQDSTILNPVIFCQIVRDLTELPCIRWVGSEKRELLMMIGNKKDVGNIKSLLSTPSNIIRNVIDRAQNCELYFSRFYSIQWLSTNASGQNCHWLSVSHSGLRFVEQDLKKSESGLKIKCHIKYANLKAIHSENPDLYGNPQRIVIKTRTNQNYEMETKHALSAINLVHEFVREEEEKKKNGSFSLRRNDELPNNLFNHKKTKRKQLNDLEFTKDPSSELMTLGVNNQRIPVKKFFEENGDMIRNEDFTFNKSGNLIDFIMLSSKHNNRDEVENEIFKWQIKSIQEPMMPSLNENLFKEALELYQFVLVLSGNTNQDSIIASGKAIFKIINRDRELNEEVILQIFKQINCNPNTKNRSNLWNLLLTLIMFFGVSKRMKPYLVQHLNQMLKNKSNPDQDLTALILSVLKKTISYGTRKEIPLEDELQHLLIGVRSAKITVCLPRNKIECNITFNNLVGEVIKNICQSFDIITEFEIAEYALSLIEVDKNNNPTRTEEYLRKESYLFDSINYLSRNKNNNFIFYFSRSSWIIHIMPMEKSQKFINFTFNQLSKDVLNENWMDHKAPDSKLIKTITAIAYFNLKSQGFQNSITEDILRSILPNHLQIQNLYSISKEELIKMINSTPEWVNITKMTDHVDYQRKFIDLVTQLTHYGWIRFPILRLNHVPSTHNLMINFTPDNISISNKITDEKIVEISLGSFTSFHASKTDANVALFTLRYNGIQEIQFSSGNLPELMFLLNQYQDIRSIIPNLGS